MSSVYTRRSTTSSLRSTSSISVITGARASTSLIAIFLGLALRVLLFFVLPSSPKLTYSLIVRLFVDFIITEGDIRRFFFVGIWTGLGLILADVAPPLWHATGARRSWHRLRRGPQQFRFDDFPSRHSAARTISPSEVTRATSVSRENVSILSSSSYSRSDSASSVAPPSILTGGSSLYTRSYAPSGFSQTNTGAPSSIVSRSESESTVTDGGTITPPGSPPRGVRRKVAVPPYPGFFPDHFSETGTEVSALPTRQESSASLAGTSHVRVGTLRSSRKDKGKARAPPPPSSDTDDMYTSSDITEDDPLTETEETESTPNPQGLQEIPDEVAPALSFRQINMSFDIGSDTSREEELEKQRREDINVIPPPTAAMPIIPDESRRELEALDLFEKDPTDKSRAVVFDPIHVQNALGLESELTKIESKDVPPPPPPKDVESAPNVPSTSAPSSPPRSTRHKPSLSSVVSAAPDITIVGPSEAAETESQWDGDVASSSIPPIPETQTVSDTRVNEADPSPAAGVSTGAGALVDTSTNAPADAAAPAGSSVEAPSEAPEPPPRENPYNNRPTEEQQTPPPSFQEALNSPTVDAEQYPDSFIGTARTTGSLSSILQTDPTDPVVPATTSDDPVSNEAGARTPTPPSTTPPELQRLDRQRTAALEEGPEGIAISITRKEQMRVARNKLDILGEEVFQAHNPWLTEGKKPDSDKPFDLSGSRGDVAIEKLEMMLAYLIRENAEARRRSVMSIDFENIDVAIGVDTLENMPNSSLLIQVDKGAKGKTMKTLIQQMCKEQKLQFKNLGLRQVQIILPNLDSDADDEHDL
ncbi:hypothetical protein DL96DRAFT_1624681 [Flagelloscypha sp. PMI_526]|nr:hypothetical protein DL96DRAFT_1624681 [Flagelloscypha sp. PMI_526]